MDNHTLASHIDATLVKPDITLLEVDGLIEAARRHKFACVFTLPCYMEYAKDKLSGSGVHIGGVAGFPSGGEFTETKLFEARKNVELGADEVDMVINIGWLKSGKYGLVRDEIRAVKDILGEMPLKCIIEISLLTDNMAKKASELVVEAGADCVKTGTGWFAPASIENIRVIRSAIGDQAYIKAAGGIRDRATAECFLQAGAHRLGIGVGSAKEIVGDDGNRPVACQ